jgi:putative transposase
MRTYKFKMYPTSQETGKLYNTLNTCRFVYNKLLESYYKYDEEADIKLTGYDLTKFLTFWKKNEYPLLKNHYSKVLQTIPIQIQSNLRGLKESKKKRKVGTLRFKSRNRFSSFTYNQSGFKVITTNKRYNKLHLSKIGDIRFKQSREIEGNIKQVQIKLKPSGWHCYIITDGIYECKNIFDNKIGVDLGVMRFMTTSDNEVFENPLYMKSKLDKIKILSKKLSKTKKGSKNRKKVISRLLRLWETIDNQKKDYFHKISTKLVINNKLLVFEDLNIKEMTNKKGKNKYHNMRNILDSSWATFVNMLKIKVSSTDSDIIFVNPRNTSKMCSGCGNIKKDLRLSDREYHCESCGLEIDRDYNASINIYRRGQELSFVGEGTLVSSVNQESPSFRDG